MRLPSLAVLLCAMCALGCNARAERVERVADVPRMTMPSPDGCFVQVWDGVQQTGASDYINGPLAYPDLRQLPNARDWHHRIASVRVGSTARALAFTAEGFEGSSFQLTPGSTHCSLPDGFAGRIASLRVDCTAPVR